VIFGEYWWTVSVYSTSPLYRRSAARRMFLKHRLDVSYTVWSVFGKYSQRCDQCSANIDCNNQIVSMFSKHRL